MSGKLNIIIVPDEGGEPHRFKLSTFWLRVTLWIAGILFLTVVAGVVSYSSLAKRALDYDRLAAENSRLEVDNRRIIRVAREVDQSRQILAKIIRSLGSHLEVGRSAYSDTLLTLEGDAVMAEISDGLYSFPVITTLASPLAASTIL